MSSVNKVTVTEFKSKLLEFVRRVEKGEAFEITKDGAAVALLSPRGNADLKATGFAEVQVQGDFLAFDSSADWTFDVDNLRPKAKLKAKA